MGRRRIVQLLAQLEANEQRGREIDAAIFTVATVAIEALKEAEKQK
jgi:hypothetical protein